MAFLPMRLALQHRGTIRVLTELTREDSVVVAARGFTSTAQGSVVATARGSAMGVMGEVGTRALMTEHLEQERTNSLTAQHRSAELQQAAIQAQQITAVASQENQVLRDELTRQRDNAGGNLKAAQDKDILIEQQRQQIARLKSMEDLHEQALWDAETTRLEQASQIRKLEEAVRQQSSRLV